MKKTHILAGAALALASGAALAQAPAAAAAGADVTRAEALQRAAAMFDRLDADDDGRVTAEEARAAHRQRREERMERRFQRMDLDGNGAVTLAEMRQSRERMRERLAERRAEHGGEHGPRRPGMRRMRGAHALGALFGTDGVVTAQEFQARAAERFDRLDRNGDGTVTAAERREARAEMRGRRGAHR